MQYRGYCYAILCLHVCACLCACRVSPAACLPPDCRETRAINSACCTQLYLLWCYMHARSCYMYRLCICMHSFLPCVYCVLRPCTRICIPVSLLRAQAAWPARHATSLRSLTRLLALTNSDYEQGNTARVGQLDTHIYVHTRDWGRAHTAQSPDSKQSPQLQDGGSSSTASIAAAAITEKKQ